MLIIRNMEKRIPDEFLHNHHDQNNKTENIQSKYDLKNNGKRASDQHKQLAAYIKKIHSQLRDESKIHGMNHAWEKHIAQNETLKTYAESMYRLATEHWSNSNENQISYCRIEWIKSHCRDYFINGGRQKYDNQDIPEISENLEKNTVNVNTNLKLKVLDVGSCYNPFNNEEKFDVTAIDIAPYSKDVLKCDFLNVKVGDRRRTSEDGEALVELEKNSFDIIIFSLLLEYIPCPEQRYLCCEKAFNLLKNGGVFFIVTPDSKHAGANTKIINTSWKVVLSKLGFLRIRYEKLKHIHCLMFRKCYNPEFPKLKINWKKISKDDIHTSKIYIPQDFQTKQLDDSTKNMPKVEYDAEEVITLFDELPCVD